jgi:adenylylsulfate kinase
VRLQQQHSEEFAKRFGLGFTAADREENIRRVGTVAELFASAAVITLVAFVSPYRRDRDAVRQRIETSLGAGRFIEVFMDTPLALCEERDPKGLYRQAREGKIANFTGISDPYEAPLHPEVHLDGGLRQRPEEYAKQVIAQLRRSHLFPI